jgi:hypothetical protein
MNANIGEIPRVPEKARAHAAAARLGLFPAVSPESRHRLMANEFIPPNLDPILYDCEVLPAGANAGSTNPEAIA